MDNMMLHKHASDLLSLLRGHYISNAVFYSSNNITKQLELYSEK